MVNKKVLIKLKNNQAYKLTFRHISVIYEVQLNLYTEQVLFFKCYLMTLFIV